MKAQEVPLSNSFESLIEVALRSSVAHVEPAQLRECLVYALFPVGKLIRPRLFVSLLEDLHVSWDKFLPFAAALEMLHVASLIHDDLPCMDNDDFRRGRATSHRVFGEGVALLAGDALPCIAFTMVSQLEIQPEVRCELTKMIVGSYCSVCQGQVMDLHSEHFEASTIALSKTGALFRVALEGAAMVAHCSSVVTARFGEIGSQLGQAFQLRDDLLDAISCAESKGRPLGSDMRNARRTALSHFDENEARTEVHKLHDQISTCLSFLEKDVGNSLARTRDLVGQCLALKA